MQGGRDGGGTFGRARSRVDSLHGKPVAPRRRRGWLCRARALATYTRKRDTVPSGVGACRAEESNPPADLIETIWDQSAHGRWNGGGSAAPSIIFDDPLPCRCTRLLFLAGWPGRAVGTPKTTESFTGAVSAVAAEYLAGHTRVDQGNVMRSWENV